MTFSSPPIITKGVIYYAAMDADAISNYTNAAGSGTITRYTGTTTFASFPVSNPTALTGPAVSPGNVPNCIISGLTTDNTNGIQELIEDGDTSYIYSSSTGEDKYSLSPVLTGYNVVMVQPYMMYKRTDVGPRTLALSLTANGSADTAVITDNVVGNVAYNYKFANLELDPTGVAWTPTSVNGAIMGITGG